MNERFAEIVNKCRKPTAELLTEALVARQEFFEAESNFITYMAGYSHHEFAESLFPHFNLAFLKGTSILFDGNSKKVHIKILMNDQSHHCKKLHLGSIERDYNSPVFMTRIAFRNQDGVYVDSLGKQLCGLPGNQARAYIAQGISGISENVVSYQRYLRGYRLVIHFVIATEPNVDINVRTVFSRVTASIFVNSLDDVFNLSPYQFQNRDDLYPLLKSIYWYVLDARQPESVIDFLQKIEANFTLVPYQGKEYDYLQDVLPEIESMVLEQCDRFLRFSCSGDGSDA
jgi:hypothetical protein